MHTFQGGREVLHPKAPYDTKWDELTTLQTSQSAGAACTRFQCLLQTILPVPTQHKLTKAGLGVPRTALGRAQRMPVDMLLLQSQQKGVPGTDSNACSKGASNPKHFGCAARVIWYFPTWSASSPGQQDRDAAETSSFQRITPGSGEVCNFWQSQDVQREKELLCSLFHTAATQGPAIT